MPHDNVNGTPDFPEDDELPQVDEAAAMAAREERIEEHVRKQEANAKSMREDASDVVERAERLMNAGLIDYQDIEIKKKDGIYVTTFEMTATNKFIALDAIFKETLHRPHLNTFLGRVVDHESALMDGHYSSRTYLRMFDAVQLRGMSPGEVRGIIHEWAFGHRYNDLIHHIESKLPRWDGKERMERFLIDLFECRDTPLNRDISVYLWLSLFSRILIPGNSAPIVISLFGVQNCGKSYFGKRLCRILQGNKDADTVQLNIGGEQTLNFLREITGQSIIAAIGEMTGLSRGDLNQIKNFITRTSDKMHYKFEGHFDQPRQWITLLDSNKYEGLQRDDTGNRRFYPVFCGQIEDTSDGKPQWSETFRAGERIHAAQFEEDVWNCMAEAEAWFNANGIDAYEEFVSELADRVGKFSQEEMAKESGTVVDSVMDNYLDAALMKVDTSLVVRRDGSGKRALRIERLPLIAAISEVAGRNVDVNHMGLKKAMKARGSVEKKSNNVHVYIFENIESRKQFGDMLKKRGGGDGGYVIDTETFD